MANSSSHTRLAYRPDVDGLRAIAVLAVVFCHAGFGMPGGYVGVDVFFVISGYLITSLILKDLRLGKFSLIEFWERRIRRIFPALAFVTLATLIASWFIQLPDAYLTTGKTLIALILLSSNIFFWRSINYFAPAAEGNPLLHTWSLSVEEQFYVVVPLLFILLAKMDRHKRALPLLILAMLASFVISVYGAYRYVDATFYLLPTRAWELLAGVVLAFASGKWGNGSARFGHPLSLLGLALILIPCFAYNELTPFPGLAAFPPVFGAVLLIWSGLHSQNLPIANRALAWKPMVFVGAISYSLYLWHWPLLALAKSMIVFPLSVPLRVGLVIASFLLSIISWRFVETPFRQRQLFASRNTLFAASSLAFVSFLVVGFLLVRSGGFPSRVSPTAREFAIAGRVDRNYVREVAIQDIPEKLVTYGEKDNQTSVLVWGDSHAMSILPAVESLAKETGLTVRAATHSLTPPVLNYVPQAKQGLGERAKSFNAAVFNYIRNEKPKAVLMVANWDSYFHDPQFPAVLERSLEELRKNEVNVYLLKDVANFPYDVPTALATYSQHGWDLTQLGLDVQTYTSEKRKHSPFFDGLTRPGITILDPVPVLQERSKSAKILPYDTGGSFYRDSAHLTTYGALALKPLLAPLFSSSDTTSRSLLAR